MNPVNKREAVLPELDIFALPPEQNSIERSYEVQYRPISSLDSTRIIEFNIPTSKDEYILLHETYLYFKVQFTIQKKENKDATVVDWASVKPANNLLHSMIKQVELEIGGKEVTMANSTYAYRAYIETMLGFSNDSKLSHLSSALWLENSQARQQYFKPDVIFEKKSKRVDLYGRLHLDMTFQGKALLGGREIKVKILTHDPDFYMEYGKEISGIDMNIIDANIYVHKMKATQKLVTAHTKALAVSPARYPITRVDLRQANIHSGASDTVLDNIVTGQLPRRMFICLVKNNAFNGSSLHNPFNFEHFKVSYAACYIDGMQFPSNAYEPDFENNLYVREYSGLFQALNCNSTDTTVNITRDAFSAGKTIFAFNFAPDLSQGPGIAGHVNPIKRGSLRVQLKFAAPLEHSITALLYCEFDNIIEIDVERNTVTDYK